MPRSLRGCIYSVASADVSAPAVYYYMYNKCFLLHDFFSIIALAANVRSGHALRQLASYTASHAIVEAGQLPGALKYSEPHPENAGWIVVLIQLYAENNGALRALN